MKKTFIVLFLSFVSIASCVTRYVEREYNNGYINRRYGYIDRRIDENTYVVNFSGNGYTPGVFAVNYLYYRCAELTVAAGKKYFVILERNSGSSTAYNTSVTRSSSGLFARTDPVNSPYSQALIFMTDDLPTNSNVKAWDANSILRYSAVDRGYQEAVPDSGSEAVAGDHNVPATTSTTVEDESRHHGTHYSSSH